MIILHSYWRSSCSWRVRIALQHKGLAYEIAPVNLLGGAQASAAHLARNPLGQVPVLEIVRDTGPVYVAQSMAILEYLEQAYPDPTLLPGDRLTRARARELAEMVNAGIQPLQNLYVLRYVNEQLDGKGRAFCQHFIRRGLEALEARAKTTAGAFLVGDAPSLADVCLVPQLYNARRFAVSLDGLPTLLSVEERCASLPGWEAAHPDAQPDRESPA